MIVTFDLLTLGLTWTVSAIFDNSFSVILANNEANTMSMCTTIQYRCMRVIPVCKGQISFSFVAVNIELKNA